MEVRARVRATIVRRSNWIPFVFYGLFNRLIRIHSDRDVRDDDEGPRKEKRERRERERETDGSFNRQE